MSFKLYSRCASFSGWLEFAAGFRQEYKSVHALMAIAGGVVSAASAA
jgi:hypothetical protein